MIVKIFDPVAVFEAVRYNTNKMDKGKGELLKVANFGPLMSYSEKRPQDFRAYLEAVSALNKRIKKPVFHAVISAGGHSHTKEQLLEIAEKLLKAMGYGDQPYLAVFHKDTKNNHIHLVSTRIDKQGKKINSGFEKVRAVRELNKIMGVKPNLMANEDVAKALTYQFSTRAQFAMILEQSGYKVREKNGAMEVIKFGEVQDKIPLNNLDRKIRHFQPDKTRSAQLKEICSAYLAYYTADSLPEYLRRVYEIDLIYHSSKGKPAYGYTVIDHHYELVFKGGEIMPIKELLESTPHKTPLRDDEIPSHQRSESYVIPNFQTQEKDGYEIGFGDTSIQPQSIWIAPDIDDEAIHGRRRKKKARTNSR